MAGRGKEDFIGWMNNEAESAAEREQALIKLYMDLTGTTEAAGRSVLMQVCSSENQRAEPTNGVADVIGAEQDSLGAEWLAASRNLRMTAVRLAPA